LQNKINKIDFNKGLLLLKIVLESDELSRIFNFFDQDCDGFISLQEFGVIYSEEGEMASFEVQRNSELGKLVNGRDA
jgi:Ca2+-binding EF-hand superfamily protein